MSNFTCPNAPPGSWRSCLSGSRFVGCCLTDPCTLGCNLQDLYPASFRTDLKIPTLDCKEPGAQFYVCPQITTSFFGCCKSNACAQDGCPPQDLSPAVLGSNPEATAVFSPTGVPSATKSASSTPLPSHSNSNSNSTVIGAAVGGAIGGLLLLCGLALFIWWRRRRTMPPPRSDEAPTTTSDMTWSPQGTSSAINPQPAELSATKSVHARGKCRLDARKKSAFAENTVYRTPPPRYISPPLKDSGGGGDGSCGKSPVQMDPVELDGNTPAKRPVHTEDEEISPQIATFPPDRKSNEGMSSQSPF